MAEQHERGCPTWEGLRWEDLRAAATQENMTSSASCRAVSIEMSGGSLLIAAPANTARVTWEGLWGRLKGTGTRWTQTRLLSSQDGLPSLTFENSRRAGLTP